MDSIINRSAMVLMILFMLMPPASGSSESYSLTADEKISIGNYEISPIKIDYNNSRVWLECQKNGMYVDAQTVSEGRTWISESGLCVYVDEFFMDQSEPAVRLSVSQPDLDVLVDSTLPCQFELSADESEYFTFTITNNGSAPVEEVHLIVSVSPGLEIESYSSTAEDMNLNLSHRGDEFCDIDNITMTSKSDLLDAWKSYDSNESQKITVTVKRICSGEQFIYFRAASGNDLSLIRYPESDEFIDQQGYSSKKTTVNPVIDWDNGLVLKSTFSSRPPVIDGVISSGEWNKVSLAIDGTDNEFIESIVGYVMNDEDYLYIAAVIPEIQAPESTYEDANPGDIVSYALEVAILDQTVGMKDIKSLESSKSIHSYYTDSSYNIPNPEEISGGDTIYLETCGEEVPNGDGVVRFSENGGNLDYTFEFKIPLNSGDPLDVVIGENNADIRLSFFKMLNDSTVGLMGEPVISWPSFSSFPSTEAHLILDNVLLQEQEDELLTIDTLPASSTDDAELPADAKPLSNDTQSSSERSTPGFGSIEGLFAICALAMLVFGKNS